jgi:NADH:ubiquinone oxidoreductase subunit E
MNASLEVIIKKYRSGKREDLIPMLQDLQEAFGFLSEESIVQVGNFLNLSTTKIYGLATFYDQFRFLPLGKIVLKVCNGTTCFLNGSGAVIDSIRAETGLANGQTSRDGLFAYEIVTCMGGCNNGPVINVNGDYYPAVKPEKLPELIKRLKYLAEND